MATKWRILRHSFTGTRAAQLVTGVVAGLAAAGVTLWLTIAAGPDRAGGALALTLASWLLGWIVGPMMGGIDPGLRREHLAHVPLTDRQRVAGLFGAALVAVGPAVTLVAGSSLVWYGFQHGPAALLVSVAMLALFLLVLVAVSNVVVNTVGRIVESRLSAALMAIPQGVLVCLGAQGWVIISAVAGGPSTALPPSVASALRAAPSGWPVVAVEAAGRGEWVVVVAAAAGLVAVVAAAVTAWALLLRRPPSPTVVRGARWRGWQPATARSAVVGKELRTWSRDLVRIHFLTFALVYALTYTLLPLLIHVTDYLPLTGVILAVLAVGCSAHLHSSDGTGLWQTLMVPGAARADVRGRQVAWLLVVAPPAVLLTAAGLLWHGAGTMAPWAVGLLPATLGAGAGLLILLSVAMPIPMTDPQRRGSNPGADGGGIAGVIWLSLLALVVLTAPATTLLITGAIRDDAALQWLATPVGAATGALLGWAFGGVAATRLATRGPDLLTRLGK